MISILDMIPCVMGLPTINENLQGLLEAMAEHPANVGLDVIMMWAKMIGLCIALGVGANECFQMMLGRRAIDVMKLVHIVIISLCITFAGSIAEMAKLPGKELSKIAYNQANSQNDRVKAKEEEVAKSQEKYLESVREHLNQLQQNERAEKAAERDGFIDKVTGAIEDAVDNIQTSIQTRIKEFALLTEMKICEWISLIIRYTGEVLFQVAYYGILVCHAIFIHILAAFAPLMFAISLAPHFKSAWSQWLSKFISISLWPFVTYICMYYVGYIMEWSLDADLAAYSSFTNDLGHDAEGNVNIAAIGMQALGTTCMYVVGLLIGVRAIAFVPEVSSWLIPGGVSSGVGSASAAMANVATSAAVGTMAAGAATVGTVATYTGMEVATVAKDVGAGLGSIGQHAQNNMNALGNSGSIKNNNQTN